MNLRALEAAMSAVALLVGIASSATAQETPVWSDIDCTQSKLVTPPGLKCRSTQEYSGGSRVASGSSANGMTRNWNALGTVNGSKVFFLGKEAVAMRSSVFPYVLADGVKTLSPQGKGAADFSSPTTITGGDFLRFTSAAGEACIGVRKEGGARKQGFQWVMIATKCAPKGKPILDEEAATFLREADFRV